MNLIDSAHIRIAYYESSCEPRLLLFGPLSVDLAALRSCFERLSCKQLQIDFHALPFVYPSDGIQLRMCSLVGGRIGLRRIDNSQLSFQWSHSNEEWDHMAELLDGLIRSVRPGHQYFTVHPADDALLVVSKGEYDDSLLQ